MNNAITTFPIKTGRKTRLITTYKNNQAGNKLRSQHQQILASLDHQIFDYDVTYAYLKKQNTKQLVQKHVKNYFFYQLDVKNFFNQICPTTLAQKLTLANITSINNQVLAEHQISGTGPGIGIGLLLSPFLSNIYLQNFDQKIKEYCLNNNIVYTRYADDLTFSAPNEFEVDNLKCLIISELANVNLKLNHQKTKITHLTKSTQSVKILGINVVRGSKSNYITISRKFKADTQNIHDAQVRNARLNYIKFNDTNFVL